MDSSEDWYPSNLPVDMLGLATATDLLRRMIDVHLPNKGKGICLTSSAVIGFYAQERGIDARLVRGEFDEDAHWWIEASGFIFDSSAGQFGSNRLSITKMNDSSYYKLDDFPCGHTSVERLDMEAKRSFFDPNQAVSFVSLALHEIEQADQLVRFLHEKRAA